MLFTTRSGFKKFPPESWILNPGKFAKFANFWEVSACVRLCVFATFCWFIAYACVYVYVFIYIYIYRHKMCIMCILWYIMYTWYTPHMMYGLYGLELHQILRSDIFNGTGRHDVPRSRAEAVKRSRLSRLSAWHGESGESTRHDTWQVVLTRDKSLILLRVEIRNEGNFGRNMKKIEDIEEAILVECLLHWEKRLKRHAHICASVCVR